MRASELIQKLQEQIELHGDCMVLIDGWNAEFAYDESDYVNSVYFNHEEENIRIC